MLGSVFVLADMHCIPDGSGALQSGTGISKFRVIFYLANVKHCTI